MLAISHCTVHVPYVPARRTPGWALQLQHKPIAPSDRIAEALLRSIV